MANVYFDPLEDESEMAGLCFSDEWSSVQSLVWSCQGDSTIGMQHQRSNCEKYLRCLIEEWLQESSTFSRQNHEGMNCKAKCEATLLVTAVLYFLNCS